MPTANLTDVKEIHDRATEKLEALQLEVFSLQHSIETSYLDLRRLVGREEAGRYLEEVKNLVF